MKLCKAILCVFFVLDMGAKAYAENNVSLLGVDLAVAHQHQEFYFVDADLTNITVSPYWQEGKWNVNATLAGYRIDGDYFANGNQPRIVNLCNRLQSFSDVRIARLLASGRLKPETLTRCENLSDEIAELEESQSGVGDVEVGVRYNIELDKNGVWWAATSAAYKFDNGDVDTGIGSGSIDFTMSFLLGSVTDTWQTQFSVGYVAVNATDTTADIQNYAIASASVGYAFNQWFTLGVDYSFQQAYIVDYEDINNITAYMDFSATDDFTLHLYTRDYLNTEDYPISELGISLQYSF